MKIWKKNLVAGAVLLTVCVGIYANWAYSQSQEVADLTDTLDSSKILSEDKLVMGDDSSILENSTADTMTDYFAAVRLSRQEARDSAVNLLQETMAYGDQESAQASAELEEIVNVALQEAQIESLVIAKGYKDCVFFTTFKVVSCIFSCHVSTATVMVVPFF